MKGFKPKFLNLTIQIAIGEWSETPQLHDHNVPANQHLPKPYQISWQQKHLPLSYYSKWRSNQKKKTSTTSNRSRQWQNSSSWYCNIILPHFSFTDFATFKSLEIRQGFDPTKPLAATKSWHTCFLSQPLFSP